MVTHQDTFKAYFKSLRDGLDNKYLVSWRVLNTADFGLPQNRPRLYIIGIKRGVLQGRQLPPFQWPPQTDRLERLFAYWRSRCGDRLFPARRDIDPVEFAFVWRDVVLLDVVNEPGLRFGYRLCGTGHVEWRGKDLTGQTAAEENVPQLVGTAMSGWTDCVLERRPNLQKLEGVFDNRRLHFWTLRLPLGDSDAHVAMLLTARQVAR